MTWRCVVTDQASGFRSIVAVDAETGKLKWYFQATHHDIWDFDMPVPPMLFDVVKDGKKIPAVGAMNKVSLLFILNRVYRRTDLRGRGASGAQRGRAW